MRWIVVVTLALAAKGLLAGYGQRHPSESAPTTGLSLAMAWSIGEGAWSPYFEGSNNYGAVHATGSFYGAHANDTGYGMLAMLESHPGAGFYIARMKVYPSLTIGAADFLAYVENGTGDLSGVTDAQTFAQGMYAVGYFESTHGDVTPVGQRRAAIASGSLTSGDQANIAAGVASLNGNLSAAEAAVSAASSASGDPGALSVGPFAALGWRLTPSSRYAPHTVAHAQALLGAAAVVPPPGGVTLADCYAANGGDGVWLFGDAGAALAGDGSPVAQAVAVGAFAGIVGALGGLYAHSRWRA